MFNPAQHDLTRMKSTCQHCNLFSFYTFFVTPDRDLWVVSKLMDRGIFFIFALLF